MKPQDELTMDASQTMPVELIGGPLCGRSVMWDVGRETKQIAYYGGVTTYQYEGSGKAVHLNG